MRRTSDGRRRGSQLIHSYVLGRGSKRLSLFFAVALSVALALHCNPTYVEEFKNDYAKPDAIADDDAAFARDSSGSSDAGAITDATNDRASAADGEAGLTGVPCHAGGQRCAFITSALYTGSLGGLAGADAKCQARAEAVALGGIYKAWLSDSMSSPSMRFTRGTGGWALVNGTRVASSYADLTDGTLMSAIVLTELGTRGPSSNICAAIGADGGIYLPPVAWSNTAPTGIAINATDNCTNWSGVGTSTTWGIGDRISGWSNGCGGGSTNLCAATQAALYCFEQ